MNDRDAASRPPQSTIDIDGLLERFLTRNIPVRTVVDIGASDGRWSRLAMKYLPDAFYLAIDPLMERKEALDRVREECAKFDYALCAAGANDGGEATLYITDALDGCFVTEYHQDNVRKVGVRTIDSLVQEKDLKGPFLLKFDTHGYERPILEGCTTTLQSTTAILMEMYNFPGESQLLRFPEMCAHLDSLGFRPMDMADPHLRPHDHALWQMDLLFGRSDHPMFSHLCYD